MKDINIDDLLYGETITADPLEGLLDNFVVTEDCPHKFSAGTGGHANDCPLDDCPGAIDADALLDDLLGPQVAVVTVPIPKKIKRIWP